MFSPIKNTTVSEKVIEQIKSMLSENKLQKGDKLPSERELSKLLEISRSSVREALKELEIMGLIYRKPGGGSFIKDSFEDILLEPFSTMFLIKESNPQEILELRRVIEKGTCCLAADRITQEDLLEIRSLLDQAKDVRDENILSELDLKFHYRIGQASKNFLLQSILNTVSALIEHFIKDVRKNILTEEIHKKNIDMQHELIYQALLEGNSELAESAMNNHLNYVNTQMKLNMNNK